MNKVDIVISMMMFCFITFLVVILYDQLVLNPIVDEDANQICMATGYNFFESYSRIPLTRDVKGLKCKYVEQYRQIDLNIK